MTREKGSQQRQLVSARNQTKEMNKRKGSSVGCRGRRFHVPECDGRVDKPNETRCDSTTEQAYGTAEKRKGTAMQTKKEHQSRSKAGVRHSTQCALQLWTTAAAIDDP